MAWQDISEQLLRYAINDVDDPQHYNASRLNTAWLIGGVYVTAELTLANKYTIDIIGMNINPDPTYGGQEPGQYADQWMVNLTTMRSAIMMLTNDMKIASKTAWLIKDIHTTADLRKIFDANKAILDEMKSLYENAKMTYSVAVNPQIGAILTPFNILAGGYRAPLYGYDNRDRLIF